MAMGEIDKAWREELRRLYGEASARPWTYEHEQIYDGNSDVVSDLCGPSSEQNVNGPLTARAINALPALLDAADERDALREEVAKFKADLNALRVERDALASALASEKKRADIHEGRAAEVETHWRMESAAHTKTRADLDAGAGWGVREGRRPARGRHMTAAARKPWHDCPAGPCGHGNLGVPIAAANDGHRAKPGDNLVCQACGVGWKGTPADVAQAERAQAAWDLECGADDLDVALREKAYGPKPRVPDKDQLDLFEPK